MSSFSILTGLIGGLGMFLYGMKLMGDGLENAAGERLKSILERLTSNKYIGVLVGAVVTAIIQSSSATTVMVVSFVSAGLMTLAQATGVIMGANIGTTITAQMVSFDLDAIAPIFVGVGAIILLIAKKKKVRDLASIALGFGILFLGMSAMSTAMKPISEAAWFKEFVIVVAGNSLLGLLAGLGMTAIVQSSSATTGILIALASISILVFSDIFVLTFFIWTLEPYSLTIFEPPAIEVLLLIKIPTSFVIISVEETFLDSPVNSLELHIVQPFMLDSVVL